MVQQRIVLDGHVPLGLEIRTGYYSKYPEGGKYPDLAEYLIKEPDRAKQAQLGGYMLARVRARARPKGYQ